MTFRANPYPNESSCRLNPPGRYKKFARVSRETHDTQKKYAVIRGQKEDGTWEDQAFRYSIKNWDEDQARKHCNAHDGNFEAAVPKENEGAVLRRNVAILRINLPLREEMFEGRRHLVAPVVALVEGVHAGATGTAFYPAEEIAKYIYAWNGIPVPVFHPQEQGTYLSAKSPQIIEEHCIGTFFNAFFDSDGAKLKGELWIDIEKAEKVAPEVLTMIRTGQALEVSTSLWTDDDWIPGSWEGEEYETTATNYRPDHIALLPGMEGACSWDDGCGVRVNKLKIEGGDMKINIRSSARTPSFEGTETVSWADVSAGFADYRDAYYQTHDKPADGVPKQVQDAPAGLKMWIASKTLLGDGNADTVQDLIFFPVVNPKTDKLNEGALRAVIGGRGAQADIPAEAKTSAQKKARQLLNKHFEADLQVDQAFNKQGFGEKLKGLIKSIANAVGFRVQEMSHEDLRDALSFALDDENKKEAISFIREVYDDNFIYSVTEMQEGGAMTGGGPKLYQRSYTIEADETITLKDDAKEVKEETRYVPVEQAGAVNQPKTGQKIDQKEKEIKAMEKKEELIQALIACDKTRFEESDEEWLKTLSEEQLGKLKAVDPPPAPVVLVAPVVKPSIPPTLDEFIANAPPEIKSVLTRAINRDRAIKEELVKALLANERNKFSEVDLKGKDIETLENLTALARIEVDYSGQGGAPESNKEKVPEMPSSFTPKAVAVA